MRSSRLLTLRAALWAVVLAQFVLIAAGTVIDAFALEWTVADIVGGAIAALTTLAFPAVGALILWRRPEHRIGWLFCVSNLGWAINNAAGPYVRYSLLLEGGTLPGTDLAAWLYTWPGLLSGFSYLLLFLLFPTGHLPSPSWRVVLWAGATWAAVASVLVAFAPGPVDDTIGVVVDNPLGVGGPLGDAFAVAGSLAFPVGMPLYVLALASLVVRLRAAAAVEREQLKWFVYATAAVTVAISAQMALFVIFGSFTTMPEWAQWIGQLGILSVALIPLAAGIAILRYRLYDIDVLINRTLVYGALSVTLAVAYFGGVVLLQSLLRPWTGGSEIAVAASTLGVVALFQPLRRRIQDAVDHRFYRSRYDAERTVEAFAERLRDNVDLDELRGDLVDVAARTLAPQHAGLWLRRGDRPG